MLVHLVLHPFHLLVERLLPFLLFSELLLDEWLSFPQLRPSVCFRHLMVVRLKALILIIRLEYPNIHFSFLLKIQFPLLLFLFNHLFPLHCQTYFTFYGTLICIYISVSHFSDSVGLFTYHRCLFRWSFARNLHFPMTDSSRCFCKIWILFCLGWGENGFPLFAGRLEVGNRFPVYHISGVFLLYDVLAVQCNLVLVLEANIRRFQRILCQFPVMAYRVRVQCGTVISQICNEKISPLVFCILYFCHWLQC